MYKPSYFSLSINTYSHCAPLWSNWVILLPTSKTENVRTRSLEYLVISESPNSGSLSSATANVAS